MRIVEKKKEYMPMRIYKHTHKKLLEYQQQNGGNLIDITDNAVNTLINVTNGKCGQIDEENK